MPGGDRTGPQGYGPRTGRGLGYCSGYGRPGYANPPFRRGYGFFGRRGRGFGRGRGFWYRGVDQPVEPIDDPREAYLVPNIKDEKTYLQQAISDLEQELKNLKDRLTQLKSDQEKTP